MKFLPIFIAILLMGGCGAKQESKPEATSGKPANAESAPITGEETPSDPYAAMEIERNAVKESLAGKVAETPASGENSRQKVYSGVIEIAGKGSPGQTILLKSNRGTFVLFGEKGTELLANEGKFVTVLGMPTKNNPVSPNFKDYEQIQVEGVIQQKLGK